MKPAITIMTALFCVTSAISCAEKAPGNTPVARHGALRVEGTKIVGEDGSPAVLHGVSMGWHNSWPRW